MRVNSRCRVFNLLEEFGSGFLVLLKAYIDNISVYVTPRSTVVVHLLKILNQMNFTFVLTRPSRGSDFSIFSNHAGIAIFLTGPKALYFGEIV